MEQRRPNQVKNKAPAPVQITAEQLLREAHEHKEEDIVPARQRITDKEELAEYRMRKRKQFEDVVRRQRYSIGTWMKYAIWEASQKEFDRARSVYERALDVDYRNQSVWLKYIEMEMKNRFINHARNLWDRAVQLLPRVDQFWYKFAHMEEMLSNVAGARQIYERWMQWNPDPKGWAAYINLEMRHSNVERARSIYERFLISHNEVDSYLKYAKFELKMGEKQRARVIYERAVEELGEEGQDEKLFVAFAHFEESCQEYERARAVYKYALDNVPKHKAESLYNIYTSFEKKHGDRNSIEEVIFSRRRFQYEQELQNNPRNYDIWLDYVHLEESRGDVERTREIYERAIGQLPPMVEKRYWRRYIYLWINFAVWEELEAKDTERARAVWSKALEVVPHKEFTFSKLWLMFAHFEVRQLRLDDARKLLGRAIGEKVAKEKVYRGYIELEQQLGNIDRCRKLYEKYLESMPENCAAWTAYAQLEDSLAEAERSRAIFELAISQEKLDMPELLWKAYIDMELRHAEHDRVRQLYTRLLQRTSHVKVWISRAQFEASIGQYANARAVLEEADKNFKEQGQKEERVLVLEAWRDLESKMGSAESLRTITARMPRKRKAERDIVLEDGTVAGREQYVEYVFPEDDNQQANLKLLQAAMAWKKQKMSTDTQ